MAKITCGNCHNQHDSVEAVRACYANEAAMAQDDAPLYKPGTAPVKTKEFIAATSRQMSYLNSLLAEREVSDEVRGAAKPDISKELASVLINKCLQFPKKRSGSGVSAPEPITEGMYKVGTDVYKVQAAVNGSGRLYAKKLVGQTFVYSPGAMKVLRPEHKMTLEQAKEWGLLYGTCCVCGRTLTDERSIAAGIGPVCANKGWWQ